MDADDELLDAGSGELLDQDITEAKLDELRKVELAELVTTPMPKEKVSINLLCLLTTPK